MSSLDQPMLRGGAAWTIGGALIAAAAASAFFASHEMRAIAVTGALAMAESAATPDRRADALAEADAALALGAPTGELRELAAARALMSDPPDLDLAEAQTWDALRRSPARAGAWARLAYIDAVRHGALTPEGVSALAMSYEVEPFASEPLRHWRVELIMRRWSETPDWLHDAALREAQAAISGARWYEEREWTQGLSERLPDPARSELQAAISRARP